jgi:hypothetical protein
VIRHQINIRRNALSSEADSGSREESPLFQLFSSHFRCRRGLRASKIAAGNGSFSGEAAEVKVE